MGFNAKLSLLPVNIAHFNTTNPNRLLKSGFWVILSIKNAYYCDKGAVISINIQVFLRNFLHLPKNPVSYPLYISVARG